MKKILAILFTVLALGILGFALKGESFRPPPMYSPYQATVPLNADHLLSLINEHRRTLGLKPFIKDERLCKIADDRVSDQNIAEHVDNHVGFIDKYHKGSYSLGENIVGPSFNDAHALSGWLSSPPHRKAIEGGWTYTCVGVQGRFAVEIFSSFDALNHNALN